MSGRRLAGLVGRIGTDRIAEFDGNYDLKPQPYRQAIVDQPAVPDFPDRVCQRAVSDDSLDVGVGEHSVMMLVGYDVFNSQNGTLSADLFRC